MKSLHHSSIQAARNELGISSVLSAKPLQAAAASAASFAVGAALPLGVAARAVTFAPPQNVMMWIAGALFISPGLLGVVAARAGGSGVWSSVGRVTFWGLLAMAATAAVGRLFNLPV